MDLNFIQVCNVKIIQIKLFLKILLEGIRLEIDKLFFIKFKVDILFFSSKVDDYLFDLVLVEVIGLCLGVLYKKVFVFNI